MKRNSVLFFVYLLIFIIGCAPAIHNAVRKGDITKVQKLIDDGADVNTPHDGYTPLIIAAMQGRDNVVEFLLKHGADPRITREGKTPRMIAQANGFKYVAQMLNLAEYQGYARDMKLDPTFLPVSKVLTSAKNKVESRKSDSKITLSVMDINITSGLAPSEVIMLTDKLINEFVANGIYKVVERSKRDEILREQGFQQSGACDQGACLVEAGQLLGVQKMVGGTIGQLGSVYGVELRVMDVRTGEIDQAFSRQYSGEISALLDAIKDAAAVFSGMALENLQRKDKR